MKKRLLLFCTALSFVFTGCLDMVEEISLSPTGAGQYKTSVDMSGAFEMLEMLAAMDTSANNGLDKLKGKEMDSSFSLKPFTDTSTKLTAAQKQFFSRATIHMQMNAEKKKMLFDMNIPFDKPEDINQLTQMAGNGKAFGLMGDAPGSELMKGGSEEAMPSFDIYDFHFAKGLLERKVNEKKLAAFKANNKMKGMEEAQGMLEQMKMKTVIHLPAAAKKMMGERARLSDDKKTVTINASFADIFKSPSALAYRVEY